MLLGYAADDDAISVSLRRIITDFPQYILPLHAKTRSAPDGIFFYSTFFTSVWVWLYVVSGFALRMTESIRTNVSRAKAVLDIDDKPLRSIGFVSNILITAGYIATWPFLRS